MYVCTLSDLVLRTVYSLSRGLESIVGTARRGAAVFEEGTQNEASFSNRLPGVTQAKPAHPAGMSSLLCLFPLPLECYHLLSC